MIRAALGALLAVGLAAAAPAREAEPDLGTLLARARAAGAEAAEFVGTVCVAQATARSLLRDGDIDFKFAIDIDLPLDVNAVELDRALTAPVEETGRHVVIVDVALAKASRKVRDMKGEPSEKVVEVIRHKNPAYELAHKQLQQALTRWDRLAGRSLPDVKAARFQGDIAAAERKLLATPQHIEQPVLGPYSFGVADIDAKKVMTVNTIVVDKVARRYVRSLVDVVETQRFALALGIDSTDPHGGRIRADHAVERDVKDWETGPVFIPLSRMLVQAAGEGATSRPFASAATLLDEIRKDRNAAVARAAAETYDDRPLNDPRFDSVVAIFRRGEGMGAGFYVRPSLVMTNWHVVRDSPIVELKLYDRRESFGQVIAKDVRLDLALIKVQDRGRPVEFFTGKDLRPGDPVDAIGHPKRQLFSITRGIVSAIRRAGGTARLDGSGASPVSGGGDGVLYIQTDAEINPGNSGGPLFAGTRVVGINALRGIETHGTDTLQNPGHNFAIHYSEAVRFLNDALKGE